MRVVEPYPEVEQVDIASGVVRIEGGIVLDIVTYLDCDGEDCAPDEATVIVAGTDEFGWVCIELVELETIH